MYAVIRTGGKQYRVEEGRTLTIDRLAGEAGDTVELGEVLLMADGEEVTIGAPLVAGARVVGTIAEQGRARKIVVFRYKSKTRSRKKTGHRAHYTRLIISDILAAGQDPKPKAARKAAPAAEEPVAEAPAEEEAVAVAEAVAETPAAEKPKRRTRKKAETE